MSLKLFFLRHGQTASSRDNDFCGSGTDAPMTEDGHAMAKEFAEYHRATKWTAVYCSPQQRALQTAQPVLGVLPAAHQVRDGLKEIGYGAWEGKTLETVQRDYSEDYKNWLDDPAWHAPTSGETAMEVAQRVSNVLLEIRREHSRGNVLIVSHKATIRIALCVLLGIDVSCYRLRLACPVASVSVVEVGPRGAMLTSLADRSHLNSHLRELPGT
jgi:probable phosphoglycerate mutase